MTTSKPPQNKNFKSIKAYLTLIELNNQALQLASNIGYQFRFITDTIKLDALSALTLLGEGSALGKDEFIHCTQQAKGEVQSITACLDIIEAQQTDNDRQLDTSTIRLLLKRAIKQLNTLIKQLQQDSLHVTAD
jgi:hypothetical protein